jgi:hypothetical protein
MRSCLVACWGVIGLCTMGSAASPQTVVYTLAASAAELSTDLHRYGFQDDASSGMDAFDVPEPPAPPADFLSLAFVMPGPSVPLPNRWRDDIRAVQDFADCIEIWELHVTTDRIGAECAFDLEIEEGDQFALRLTVIGPDGGEFPVQVPGGFTMDLTGPESILWLVLTADGPIASTNSTWGGFKVSYR